MPSSPSVPTLNADAKGSPKSPAAHMAKRRKQGATFREIGGEHGVAGSTAHRNVMRKGFVSMGSAKA